LTLRSRYKFYLKKKKIKKITKKINEINHYKTHKITKNNVYKIQLYQHNKRDYKNNEIIIEFVKVIRKIKNDLFCFWREFLFKEIKGSQRRKHNEV